MKFLADTEIAKLTKTELVEAFKHLQEYAAGLERPDLAIVTVSSKVFFQYPDFLPEVDAFLKDISLVEMDDSGSKNWMMFKGRIRSNLRVVSISRENGDGWERHFTKGYVIPARMVHSLQNFLYALNTQMEEMKKSADEQGANLLIQQLRHDVIGAI